MNTRQIVLVGSLLVAAFTSGCSASVREVRRDPGGGTLRLAGPLVPAHQQAREAIFEHCHGRYTLRAERRELDAQGESARYLEYGCAQSMPNEVALNR